MAFLWSVIITWFVTLRCDIKEIKNTALSCVVDCKCRINQFDVI